MKSSFGKLKRFSLHKTNSDVGGGSNPVAKEKKDHQHHQSLAHLEALSQEMKEMRDCCDTLLSAAAATTNSAYEFSESLLEMGNCLLETTSLDNDGECGRALSVLGKAQLEIQKLVDGYRSNVILTITNPSESLLSELRKVEEMKQQCDEKRYIYEHMVEQHGEKGKSRSGKGERITSQQLQAASEEYDEAARLCIFRVESLKQGQCRSLLTQAARHHAAQLVFFRKGLKSLEAIEPYMKNVAQNQHIDYLLTDLDEAEDVQDSGNSDVSYYDGELSFDNNRNKKEHENTSFSRNSSELDISRADAPLSQSSGLDDVEINFGTKKAEQISSKKTQFSYHSAPIYADKFDASEKIRETQTPVQKFHAYVLPTPADAARNSHSRTSSASVSGSNNNLWHSTPLDAEKARKFMDDKAHSGTKDGDQDSASIPLPFPVMEGGSLGQFDMHKAKRQAFSGPLLSKPASSSGPIERLQVVGGMPPRVSTSHHAPQSVSPPLASSPKISELHELPRPPPSKPVGYSGYSAPLGNRKREVSPTSRSSFAGASGGSPLPTPPPTVSRSYSIPSSKHRAAATQVLERHEMKEKVEEVLSPPLTPISMSNAKPATVITELGR